MKEKKKLTPAELSAVRSAAGRKGGSAPKHGRPKVTRTQIQVARFDRDVLADYATKKDTTIAGAVHFLARVILQNNPDVKRPKDWID